MPLTIKQAESSDLITVLSLLDQRVFWLRQRGSDQWSTSPTFPPRMTKYISQGETWLMLDQEQAIGTITIGTHGNPEFWTPTELEEKAFYISKMATAIDRRGQGLGELIISWVRDLAAQQGVGVVRWDAWRGNELLHGYYRGLGARYVRTSEKEDHLSGVLFEIPAVKIPGLGSCVVTCVDQGQQVESDQVPGVKIPGDTIEAGVLSV